MCICPPWYSGLTCSKRIDPCVTCLTNYDMKPSGYSCQCLPGFIGQMCEINVDDCQSQPCKYGRCIDNINGFICQCYEGFDGILCDVS
jgi:hypothetical protein